MASPSVTGTPTTSALTSGSTFIVNLPLGIVAGETLLVFIYDSGGGSAPAGWTKTFPFNNLEVYFRLADGTEGSTVTITITSSKAAAVAYRITGAADPTVSGVYQASGASGASGTNPDPPSVTPTGGSQDYLFAAVAGVNADVTATAYPTNYSMGQKTVSSGGTGSGSTKRGIAVAFRQLTASTDDPGTFTFSGAGTWDANTLAVFPAAAAAATSDVIFPAARRPLMRTLLTR
jgi:hypothetical protein